MANFTLRTLNTIDAYDAINELYNVNAHFGKVGNMVRFYGTTDGKPHDRAELWVTRAGYDMYIGIDTPLYSVGKSLIDGEWSNAGKLKYSVNKELVLQGLTGSDVALILDHVRKPAEEPKKTTTKRGKGKGKNKTTEQAV